MNIFKNGAIIATAAMTVATPVAFASAAECNNGRYNDRDCVARCQTSNRDRNCDQNRNDNHNQDRDHRNNDNRHSNEAWRQHNRDWRRYDRSRYETRQRTFVGKIVSIGSDSFVLKTVNNGQQLVSLTSSTEIRKNGHSAEYSDLRRGSTVTVRGSWDRSDKDISATSINIIKK